MAKLVTGVFKTRVSAEAGDEVGNVLPLLLHSAGQRGGAANLEIGVGQLVAQRRRAHAVKAFREGVSGLALGGILEAVNALEEACAG